MNRSVVTLCLILLAIAGVVLFASSSVKAEDEFEPLDASAVLADPSDSAMGEFLADSSAENIFKCMKIYGNYCGPGWCDKKWWSGCKGSSKPVADCTTRVKPVDEVDKCCQIHDRCCIDSRKKGEKKCNCDKAFVECLENAECSGQKSCSAKTVMLTTFKLPVGCC